LSASQIPYMSAYGSITRALEAIKKASTPDRFTQDFLSTRLGLKGGSPKPVIPYLKRTGFLNSDGSPTDIYIEFRNDAHSGQAAARALQKGYQPLYEINEYVHELEDKDLKGVIIQATGWENSSVNVKAALGSFKALRDFANFDGPATPVVDQVIDASSTVAPPSPASQSARSGELGPSISDLRLGYTINLNLPATSDIAVFNAIFQSLKEHLLR
jgi:hypothetical protein